jgi:streptomycin 6-kinase
MIRVASGFSWKFCSCILMHSSMPLVIPKRLSLTCARTTDASNWLAGLASTIQELQDRWALQILSPFDHEEVSCAWVAPVIRRDGSAAVLKVSLPHFEAEHEIAGLRFWDGDPTVTLIDADERLVALLLERVDPGTHLRALRSEAEQDVVIAELLRRAWRAPEIPHPFRPLRAMIAQWADETRAQSARWPDAALVRDGLSLLDELSRPRADDVLLTTDLHAGNVLRAQRQEWLVIDLKPFIGDRAYDATQHLVNCLERVRSTPTDTIQRFADLVGVDGERVRSWLFARMAAEPRDDWAHDPCWTLARAIAP